MEFYSPGTQLDLEQSKSLTVKLIFYVYYTLRGLFPGWLPNVPPLGGPPRNSLFSSVLNPKVALEEFLLVASQSWHFFIALNSV